MDRYRVGPRCHAGREGTLVLSVVNADGSLLSDRRDRPRGRTAVAGRRTGGRSQPLHGRVADQREDKSRRLAVRNGYHHPRKVTTTAGVVEVKVKVPGVNDKRIDQATGERKRFS